MSTLPLLKMLGRRLIIDDVPFAEMISESFGTSQKSRATDLKLSINVLSGRDIHTHFGIFGIGYGELFMPVERSIQLDFSPPKIFM